MITPLVRAGVRAELESSGADFDIVGEASDVEGAIAACHALTPDVALLDVHLPGRKRWRRGRSCGLVR